MFSDQPQAFHEVDMKFLKILLTEFSAGWLAGWLAGLLAGWLAGWLAG